MKIPYLITISSSTNVDLLSSTERGYFANTTSLLVRHVLGSFAKNTSDQLTQERVDNQDVTLCMNQVVINEANASVKLPGNVRNWDITDIGEGSRTVLSNQQITKKKSIMRLPPA